MWLLFFHENEDKKISKKVALLKEYAENKYEVVKHISYLKFIPYGEDIIFVHHKGNEIGIIMKVEVI